MAARASGVSRPPASRSTKASSGSRRLKKRRLDMPCSTRTRVGSSEVATLREVEPHSTGDRVMRYFTETDDERGRRAAVHQAAHDRHQQLLTDREGAGAFYLAAREVAEQHIEQLQKIDPQRELPAPHYTAKEVAQIETFAAKQKDEESRVIYEEMVRAAMMDGRVGYAKPERPEQTQSERDHEREQTAENSGARPIGIGNMIKGVHRRETSTRHSKQKTPTKAVNQNSGTARRGW